MLATAVAAVLALQQPTLPPTIPREFRGAWVATVDNIDWPSKKGLSTEAAKAELLNLIGRCAQLNLNALVFQVRPMADALYPSPYEPWSEFLTGVQGKAPNPAWDPLKFAIEQCHARGIELHAWFNPYRAWHSVAKSPPSSKHVSRRHPELVRQYGKQKWMDPGDPRVQNYTMRTILDVVKRYDIDGVHIDDYFYPYPIKGTPFPDNASYKAHGQGSNRGDWRRKSVDRFVERMYREVHKAKPWVRVGVSPFGIYRPGVPKGIEAGIDQVADLYADPLKWLKNGWLDYLSPQLYWSIDSPKQPFPTLLRWWDSKNTLGRHLWPGLATYKMNEGPKWGADELVSQIELLREEPGSNGHIHFSAKYLVRNTKAISDRLAGDLYRGYALPPARTWLDKTPPSPPVVTRTETHPASSRMQNLVVEWKPADTDTFDYVLLHRWFDSWGPYLISRKPNLTFQWRDLVGESPIGIAIYARDKAGNLSQPVVALVPGIQPNPLRNP